jgi:N6-L-threonylcarbamoyladenine synthase
MKPADAPYQALGLFAFALGDTCGAKVMQRDRPVRDTITVLGLESSCDDTAAAVVRCCAAGTEILSSVVFGQYDLHSDFGGVVPEIAARAHAEKIDHCVAQALGSAGLGLNEIDAIAVTAGPGLIGGVVSGVMCAKGLSAASGKPLYGINHLAGHALTPRLTDGVPFPYLMLLVSGGHCQFLIAHGPTRFERLGGTIDDAPGEAFDKVARLLGLPQPGGPAVEALATTGDAGRFSLPRPLLDRPGCDLSFSGLKTAVLRLRDGLIADQGGLWPRDQADICAAFQQSVTDVLAEKTRRAMAIYQQLDPQRPTLCVAGGVAANQSIGAALRQVAQAEGAGFIAPPLALCTDNAAMIAFAAIDQMPHVTPDDFTLAARPRWPLDQSSPAMLGSGKKGAKA